MASLNKTLIFFFVLIVSSCSVGKQGVYYAEIDKTPIISANDNMLTIKTGNSTKNSALLIYKIDYEADIAMAITKILCLASCSLYLFLERN